MNINRVTSSSTVIVDAVFKMYTARTLFPTGLKCSLGKNYTFLITFESPAVVAIIFIPGAANACAGWNIAQHIATKVSNRFTVEPFRNGHVCNIVLRIAFSVYLVFFLTADTQTSVPVYVNFVPGSVTKDFLIRHGYVVSCRLGRNPVLLEHS